MFEDNHAHQTQKKIHPSFLRNRGQKQNKVLNCQVYFMVFLNKAKCNINGTFIKNVFKNKIGENLRLWY